jgi:hypothetical protein
MKAKEDLKNSIHVIDSNFEHIAKTGKINGTLSLEIDRILDEHAKAAIIFTLEELNKSGFNVGPTSIGADFFLQSFNERVSGLI